MTTMQEYAETQADIETYVPISWKDGPHGNTPLSAENLNKMDTQLKDLTDFSVQLRKNLNETNTQLKGLIDFSVQLRENLNKMDTQPWSVIAECDSINHYGQMQLSTPITPLPETFKTGDELCVKLTDNVTARSDKLKLLSNDVEITIKDFTTPRYYKTGYMIIFRFLDNLNVEELALITDVDAIKQELLSVSNSLDTINGEVI